MALKEDQFGYDQLQAQRRYVLDAQNSIDAKEKQEATMIYQQLQNPNLPAAERFKLQEKMRGMIFRKRQQQGTPQGDPSQPGGGYQPQGQGGALDGMLPEGTEERRRAVHATGGPINQEQARSLGLRQSGFEYINGNRVPKYETATAQPSGAYGAMERGGFSPQRQAEAGEKSLLKADTTVNLNQGPSVGDINQQLGAFKSGQQAIDAFVNNPLNSEFIQNKKFGLKTNTKGELIFDVQDKDRPTAEQIMTREFRELLKNKVERLRGLVAKGLTGPVEGPVRGLFAETIGGQDEFVEMKQLLDSLILRAYMLSGKQISGPELDHLKGMQPQANDPDTTAMKRLDGFFEELQVMSEVSDKLWNELGIRTPKSAPKKDVRGMSMEELKKLVGGNK